MLDNVADGLLYAGIPLRQRRQRALDALELVGLAQRPHARPTQLSGGQRQRVAIARALVGQPAIVLADEPTGNLDQATGQSILALIDQLHQAGSTIVVITHDHAIAERMPRKVEILDGQIVADTGPAAGTDPRLRPLRQPADPGRADCVRRARRRGAVVTATATLSRRRLPLSDLTRLSTVGLRTRKLRAGLSALGIAIGVAAIVAVLGLSASSQAGLLDEINQLGTNLLTVSNGQSLTGGTAELPTTAPAMIGRISGVQQVQSTGAVSGANAYRTPYIPSVDTNGLTVQAASLDLLPVLATTVAQGHYLNAATAQEPVAVLGAAAAQLLGIDRIYPGERIWVGGQWFYLAGILKPAVLASAIDTSVLVGYPAAKKYLGFDGHPSTIYLRAQNDRVNAVDNLLAATANPESPSEVNVSQPSSALVAQADAKSALNGLFLGLGAVALLVGAVGVANIMIISVLERRSEIGLRRALGATRGHIRTQFLSEAILLGLLGGAVGVALGAACHRRLRPHQTLGHRHPHRSLGRRHRRLPHHRRGRRAHPRPARRTPLTHPSPVVRLGSPQRGRGPVSASEIALRHSGGHGRAGGPQVSGDDASQLLRVAERGEMTARHDDRIDAERGLVRRAAEAPAERSGRRGRPRHGSGSAAMHQTSRCRRNARPTATGRAPASPRPTPLGRRA